MIPSPLGNNRERKTCLGVKPLAPVFVCASSEMDKSGIGPSPIHPPRLSED